MNALFAAALDVQRFCRDRGWPICVIGGVAVQRWGEPRFTRDVYGTILVGFGSEGMYIDALLERFTARIAHAREFAFQHRVLLVSTHAGVPVDLSLGALPFEERLVERASPWTVGDQHDLLTCSAEDLIVLKAFAGRDRDWADIAGIVERQAGHLDRALIWSELRPLLEAKEEPTDAEDRLQRLFRRADGRR